MFSNYRFFLQKKQISWLKEDKKRIQDILNKSKFKIISNYDELIRTNFIQYNGETLLLLIRLMKNIYCCYKQYGIPCTYLLTPKQLTDKNEKLKISKSINSTKSRLAILEEEGVIGKVKITNKGSFYYLTADITQPFNRSSLKTYKLVNSVNTNEITKIEDNDYYVENGVDDKQEEQIEIENNIDKIVEILTTKEKELQLQDKDIKECEEIDKEEEKEITEQDLINEELDKIDIGDNSKAEFKAMFWEFCDAREGVKGKLKKKSKIGIKLALKELKTAREEGYDPYKVLEESLGRCWIGITKTKYSKIKTNSNIVLENYNTNTTKELNLQLQDYCKLCVGITNKQYGSQEEAIKDTIAYQMQKLNTMAITLAKKEGKEIALEKFKKDKENKLETSKRIYSSCSDFLSRSVIDKNKPVNKNLFLNILDKGIGEKTYLSLMEYYKNCISIKYPIDKERRETFTQIYKTILKIAIEKIDYIPLLFVVHIMNSKLPINWTDNIKPDLLEDIYNENMLVNFILKDVLNYKYKMPNGEVYKGYITTKTIEDNKLKYSCLGINFENEQSKEQKSIYCYFFGAVIDNKNTFFNDISYYDIIKFFLTIDNFEVEKKEKDSVFYYKSNIIQNSLLIQRIEDFLEKKFKIRVKFLKRN